MVSEVLWKKHYRHGIETQIPATSSHYFLLVGGVFFQIPILNWVETTN